MWFSEDFFELRIVAPLARQFNHPSVFQTSVKHELSCHSPSLRYELCWYRIGLSDLAAPKERFLRAPTERLDTSIARQGYDNAHRTFSGLKDRRILPRTTLFTRFHPNLLTRCHNP